MAQPPETAVSANPETILEQDVPLSRSLIWQSQEDFYVQRGLRAWTDDLVPSYITNNPFIAEIYADIIAAFAQDCLAQNLVSQQRPLRILELGAGTGKFAYLLLRRLTTLFHAAQLPLELLRYEMTDCSESLLVQWRENPWLAQFSNAGLVKFQMLRVGEAPAEQSAEQRQGPLVVIANYVFDSLAQDAFRIENHDVYELRVTTSSVAPALALKDLRFSWTKSRVQAGHYADETWNGILEQYRSRITAATVLFPVAALQSLERLRRTSDGTMLVLAADKGLAYEEDLALIQGDPSLEFHAAQSCFSQVVNFDAIAKWFRSHGGEALLPDKRFSQLSLCAFLHLRPGDNFPATHTAYRHTSENFTPDDLFGIMSWLNDRLDDIALPQALALLRLARWDSTAFARLFPALARHARNAHAQREDLRAAVLRCWENYYPLTREENILSFYCGVILLELRFFPEAYAMLRKSQELFGPSAATSYNLGLCCLGLARNQEALELMREACALDPSFEPAQQSRKKLEDEFAPGPGELS